jgi:hypothetical protein
MSSGHPAELKTCAIEDGADAIWAMLRKAGAVIVKRAAASPDGFTAITEQFATRFRIHQDPGRPRYGGDDTTQGVATGGGFIDLHAERAYLPAPPELLFFWCLTPSSSGGATTVCDGAALLEALPSDDGQRWSAMTLIWRTRLERPMWQRMWRTDDPDHALARLGEEIARDGATSRSRCAIDGDALTIAYQAPALDTGWIGHRRSFANYLLLHRHEPDGPQATQADGTPVPTDLLDRAAAAAETHTVDILWHAGDLAIIDNTRYLHGRRAFTGGDRRILVRMGDAHPRFRA